MKPVLLLIVTVVNVVPVAGLYKTSSEPLLNKLSVADNSFVVIGSFTSHSAESAESSHFPS